MQINTCCGYESEITYDLCPECFEHCDWEELEEEDEEEKIKDEQDQNDMDEIMLRAAKEKLNNQ
jgi:hypothetical protein